MTGKKHIWSIALGLMVFSLLSFMAATAQGSPIEIKLIASKTTYLPGEPIKMQIDVKNVSGNEVIAQEGFFGQHFYLMMTFTGPDKKSITTMYKDVGNEGGPPYLYYGQASALVERIATGAVDTTVIEDAKMYYNLAHYGNYKAKVLAFLETYSSAKMDANTGKLISSLSDQTFSDTVVSNEVLFDVLAPEPVEEASIEAGVNLLKIGTGTKPPVERRPLDGVTDGVSVRLYERASLAEYEPINWKTYGLIWNDLHIAPLKTALPDATGKAIFGQVPQDAYILMTSYEGIYAASRIEADDPGWASADPIDRHLQIMQKANGKKTPGKTTKKTGSLLLITEPEYIEWDSTQELYPFVFETLDEWSVAASVAPPEGFVTDYEELSAEVTNETESLQFTITDVGSKWEETEVTYKIKHKGKTEVLKSKIGIKLSKKLAKEKNKSIYGDTEGPGIFEDGKKKDKKIKEGK